MWIFLRKIHLAVAASVYTNPENAIAARSPVCCETGFSMSSFLFGLPGVSQRLWGFCGMAFL
jgi:hypothetical protein